MAWYKNPVLSPEGLGIGWKLVSALDEREGVVCFMDREGRLELVESLCRCENEKEIEKEWLHLKHTYIE